MKPLLWGLALGLVACTVQPPSPQNPDGWLSVQTLEAAQVLREKVSYRSSGYKVWGQVCRPNREGLFPIVLLNHGGFEGLAQDWQGGACKALAQQGYAVLESSYRGEDNSEGEIEICLGEADDVLRMLEIGRGMPYVQPQRVAVFGGSHGGCISLRAVQKRAQAQVLVALFPPTDWATQHAFLQQQAQTSSDSLIKQASKALYQFIELRLGGPPQQSPLAYQQRSPVAFAQDLATFEGSVLLLHGVQDWVVPVSQSCDLAKQVGGFAAFRITDANQASSTPPQGCEAFGLLWQNQLPPQDSWPMGRYLVVYDRYGHGDGDQAALAIGAVIKFLLSRFPPN